MGMVKKFADSENVSSGCELQGGKCIAEPVEGDAFCYSGGFQPFFQRTLSHVPLKILEYFSCTGLTTQRKHFGV